MDYNNTMSTKDADYDLSNCGNNNSNDNMDLNCGDTNGSYNDNNSMGNNDNNSTSSQRFTSSHGISKAELRKSNKPIMEKKRRARINHCLNELKTLILEAMKKDPARHTKLEKADILEMTVKHLQSLQRQQISIAMQSDPTVIHKFKTGFFECAEEVNRYIGQLEGVESTVKQRLINHLNTCGTGLEQIGSFNNFSSAYRGGNMSSGLGPPNVLPPSTILASSTGPSSLNTSTSFLTPAANRLFPFSASLSQDFNNNNNSSSISSQNIGGIGIGMNSGRIQMDGMQLIPSRLPSGELALIMPNSSSIPFFIPNCLQQRTGTALDFTNSFSRVSAFTKPSPIKSNVDHSIENNYSLNFTNISHNNNNETNSTSNSITTTSAAGATSTITTTHSPPLSPISSISSLGGDDSSTSIIHINSEFGTKLSPKLEQPLSSSSAVPAQIQLDQSSGYLSSSFLSDVGADTSFKEKSPNPHLQQPHVSSTSETCQNQNYLYKNRQDSKIEQQKLFSIRNEEKIVTKRRRSTDINKEDKNNDEELLEPLRKKVLKSSEEENEERKDLSSPSKERVEHSNDMWRPW